MIRINIILLVIVCLCGCISPPDKKLFIKSIQINELQRIDWYFFSLIGGFSKSHLQFEDNKGMHSSFFESFYLSDVTWQNGTLTIQLWENDYKLDKQTAHNLGLVIKIDTTGNQWNQASSRLGRLKSKNVNVEHYHFVDSYCPKGECY